MDLNVVSKVLLVGNSYIPPKGGMAQLISSYDKYIFPEIKYVVNYKPGSIWIRIWSMMSGLCHMLWMLIFDNEIRIVHIHSGSGTSFTRSIIFAKLARFFRKTVILHMHGGGFKSYYSNNKNYVDKSLKYIDYIIALTETWKSYFLSIGYSNVKVINNIIDIPRINNNKSEEKIHFLYLGLICDAKGVFDLLEVCNLYKSSLSDKIEIHVAGNGEIERLDRYIIENNLSNFVKYDGWVSGDKKDDLLNSADIFILPSYAEGLPISILEALSYGLYIIATDVGGIPEVVNPTNGIIIAPGNKSQLISSIFHVISNIEEIKQSAHERTKCADPYMPDLVAHELCDFYKYIIDNVS